MFNFLKRQNRAKPTESTFTSLRINEIETALANTDISRAKQLACVEAAANLWGRALSAAAITPSSKRTAAIDSNVLSNIGRALVKRGEVLYIIDIEAGKIKLTLADYFYIIERADGYWYSVSVLTPSSTNQNKKLWRYIPATQVLHFKAYNHPIEHWRGVSPLTGAAETIKLLLLLEIALTFEAGGPVSNLVNIDAGLSSEQRETALKTFKDAVMTAKGSPTLSTSTTASGGEFPGDSPIKNYAPMRLGANPPGSLIELREALETSIYHACGIPPALATRGGQGNAAREAWRQFLHGTIKPIGKAIADEINNKLNTDIQLNFDDMFASDLSGRARAFQSMVGGGMDLSKAAAISGLVIADDDDADR